MIKRVIAVLMMSFFLAGCITVRVVQKDEVDQDDIKLVETDYIPRQLLDARDIKVKYIDSTTGKYVVTTEKLQGYYAISPALYKKLVKIAAENALPRAEIVDLKIQ